MTTSSTRLDPPLWQKLQAVAQLLLQTRQGASTSRTLEQVDAALRPGAQALLFHVLRNLGRAQALRKALAPRAPPPAADALLCSALALAWDDASAPFDAHTLVNQAVEAAKRDVATRPQANFINACLRRFLRDKAALVAQTDTIDEARWNHPDWWIARLRQDYPTHWQAILQVNNRQAPMTLRVNQAKISRADFLTQLASHGIDARPNGPHGVELAKAIGVAAIPGFANGLFSVQDAAAQMAAPLLMGLAAGNLDARHAPKESAAAGQTALRVLDACAAPGGKTAHLLELGPFDVTAIDIDAERVKRIAQTLDRLNVRATVVVGDAANPAKWWDGQLFDAILLDAPCTASGIVRRHPDVRWLRRASDIDQLARIQATMLKSLWSVLKPGGRLLYCTCSVFLAEGSLQIQTFLARHTDATLLPSPGHLLPLSRENQEALPDNSAHDHDGFYLALLEKAAA